MGQESTLASRSSYKKEKTYWPYTKPRHQAFALILGTFWSTSNVTSSTNASWSLSVSSRSNSGQQQKTRQHEPSGLWLRIIKLPTSEIKAGSLPDHLVGDPRGKQHEQDRECSDACPRSKACLRATTETRSGSCSHDNAHHKYPCQYSTHVMY